MIQYQNLLKEIKEKGTWKDAAREGMPRTLSLFGAQSRYNLAEGFPILTTKKINFKHIVTELLWFLRGDTNIKYLIDNGCNIWNEDAYNYLKKNTKEGEEIPSFEWFIQLIKEGNDKLGDCGKQYGWLWRNWEYYNNINENYEGDYKYNSIDQIKELIERLKNNPMSRRHIITAWNPATLDDMALNACHAFVQFNCRPLSYEERMVIFNSLQTNHTFSDDTENKLLDYLFNMLNIPKYSLDCKFTMRSSDVFLGLPYNTASYALLTHILAKICNMEVGDLIADLGDVHIYENHMDQVDEILTRTPTELPKLVFNGEFEKMINENWYGEDLNRFINSILIDDFQLENYNPGSSIKAKLSTGLK